MQSCARVQHAQVAAPVGGGVHQGVGVDVIAQLHAARRPVLRPLVGRLGRRPEGLSASHRPVGRLGAGHEHEAVGLHFGGKLDAPPVQLAVAEAPVLGDAAGGEHGKRHAGVGADPPHARRRPQPVERQPALPAFPAGLRQLRQAALQVRLLPEYGAVSQLHRLAHSGTAEPLFMPDRQTWLPNTVTPSSVPGMMRIARSVKVWTPGSATVTWPISAC